MGRILLAIGGLLLAGWLFTGVVEVQPGERAVVRRFGAFLDFKPGPGLRIGFPWGIDQVDRVPVDRIQTLAVGFDPEANTEEAQEAAVRRGESTNPPGQLLTGDHNLVDLRVVVSFKVPEEGLEDYVLARDRVEAVLGPLTETCLAEWVAGRRVDDVLLEGKTELPQALGALLAKRLPEYRLGIQVVDARVTHLAPPEQVKKAFDEVSRAQAGIRTQETRERQEQFTRREAAQAAVQGIERAAEGYAYTQTELARRNAQRFAQRVVVLVEAVKSNPKYLEQLWLEERARVLQRLQQTGQLGLLDGLLPTEKP